MAYYMDRGLTVKGVLDIEAEHWKRLNIIDTENYTVCYTGTTRKYTEDKAMTGYREEVNAMPVIKATTNGETLNLFVR